MPKDAENEGKVQQALDDLVHSVHGKCSVVLIAHRLSTVIGEPGGNEMELPNVFCKAPWWPYTCWLLLNMLLLLGCFTLENIEHDFCGWLGVPSYSPIASSVLHFEPTDDSLRAMVKGTAVHFPWLKRYP